MWKVIYASRVEDDQLLTSVVVGSHQKSQIQILNGTFTTQSKHE